MDHHSRVQLVAVPALLAPVLCRASLIVDDVLLTAHGEYVVDLADLPSLWLLAGLASAARL